tara:strand:- start:559 stop:735 length:177 start_codon:yes stop_codon:yes gene_type:complete
MNQLLKEKIETKLERVIAMAKKQDDVILKRGDVINDVRSTLRTIEKEIEEVKSLIHIV